MTGYICTVTAAALVVAILTALSGSGTMGALVKLVAGVFMALTVVSPLLKLELPDPQAWMSGFEIDGEAAAASGQALADEAYQAIIKQRTEAYILDKAARYGADLEVEVTLDDQGIPVAVTLHGNVSPAARAALTKELALDLGLGEEVQQWIG